MHPFSGCVQTGLVFEGIVSAGGLRGQQADGKRDAGDEP
jgi:hypothetical protein